MRKLVVIFDWDGTLLDSMAYKRENVCTTFSEFCGAEKEKIFKAHAMFSGLPRRVLFGHMAKILGCAALSDREYRSLSDDYTARNICSAKHAKLFDDAEVFLGKLRDAGVQVFVSSSSEQDELTASIKLVAPTAPIEAAFGSRPGFGKGVDHISHIAMLTNKPLTEMVFIGDDEQDVVLGVEGGVDTLRIDREGQAFAGENRDKTIASLQELLSLWPLGPG